MKWPSHGGQPGHIRKLFALPEHHEMLDFSANLNPLGPPEWVKGAWSRAFEQASFYPDPTYEAARQAIAEREGLHAGQVVLTNGGAEAIFLAARRLQGGKALVVHPTFGEYEQACRHYGVQTERVFLLEQERFRLPVDQIIRALPAVDGLFLCRPNNPTGTAAEEQELRKLLEKAREHGVLVIIDEAFADFMSAPRKELTSWLAAYRNLLLLRSMTKMFTIPGIRLGYALAAEEVAAQMRADQIPWSVNGAAAALVPELVKDRAFVATTRKWLAGQWPTLRQRLERLGFEVSDACANFYVLRERDVSGERREEAAAKLYRYLLDHGVLARHTTTFPGMDGAYLRLAVRSEAENERLLKLFARWRELDRQSVDDGRGMRANACEADETGSAKR